MAVSGSPKLLRITTLFHGQPRISAGRELIRPPDVPSPMRNAEVAQIFYDIADLLEMAGDNRFRPIAYRRAAREIEALPDDIEKLWRQGGVARLLGIPGVGQAIAEKIDQYFREGKVDALEDLQKQFPKELVQVMRLRGLGPKRASVLWKTLGVTGIEDLKRAAENRQVRRIKGFGEKTEQKILDAIKLHEEGQSRTLLAVAWPLGEEILTYLREHAPIDKASIAGSARRMQETVGDLDLLVTSPEPPAAIRTFTSMPRVKEVVLAAGAE